MRNRGTWCAALAAFAVAGTCASLVAQAPAPAFPRSQPLEPAEALHSFQALDGFRMQLLAAEPLVYDPVAGAYDEDGRLYVVEMSDYPYTDKANDKPNTENTADPPIGRVRLLIDRDGDGKFDEGHLFAEKLSWPTGIAVWKSGVFVAATPEIWYLKDTDGDFKADVREKVFTGFRKYNVQAVMNNLTWGLDHEIYGAGSSNGGTVRAVGQPDLPGVSVLRRDFRFDPDTRRLQAISGGARFGNTFDDWGNRFLCDIRNPAEHVVLPSHYLERNKFLPAPRVLHDAALAGDTLAVYRKSPPEPWRVHRAERWAAIGKAYPKSELVGAGFLTSSSGVTIYRGDAYPPGFRGNLFLGEVANNLILRQIVEPDGATFRARRAEPEKHAEFVASTDIWFRPVNYLNAPDGTLHVLDMYRETIEHPWSIPDDIKAQLDLRSGSDRGRIYRLEPPGFRLRATPRLSRATTAELVALLAHPNAWHYETAHRLLFERQDRSAIKPLRQMLRLHEDSLARLHAAWSLQGLNALTDEDLFVALADSSAGVREHALRLAEPRLDSSPKLVEKVVALAGDESIRVRFQAAFTLGEVHDPSASAALAKIAKSDAADPWVTTAVLCSSSQCAPELFEALVADKAFLAKPEGSHLTNALALVVGARNRDEDIERVLVALANCAALGARSTAIQEAAQGLGSGLARAGRRLGDLPAKAPRPVRTLLESLFADAEHGASDSTRSELDRERAIALVGQTTFAQAKATLAPLLAPAQPKRVQAAAVRALASFPESEVAPLLLAPWRGYTPALQTEIIPLLLGRKQWLGALLDAVEAKQIPAGQIPPNRQAILLKSADDAVRRRAQALFGSNAASSRAEAVANAQRVLTLSGNKQQGQKVFERECMTCHKIGEKGQAVGPNLSSVRNRTAEEILVHILDPNREVAPEFVEYVVALKDGRVATGLIESETATSLSLKRAEGAGETILRQDVEAITSTGKSLMPEGLEKKLNAQDLADLIAYLLDLQKS